MNAKIVVSGLSKRPRCLWDTESIASGKSTTTIIPGEAFDGSFLCALLNSGVMKEIYSAMFGSLSLSGGYMRVGPPQLRVLPVPKAGRVEQQRIADMVDERKVADASEIAEIDERIDSEISKLFGFGV